MVWSAGLLICAYLLGSFPGSLVAGWLGGRDIRRLGDGNVGAHNVMRHVGRGWGMLALTLDAAKGALAVLLARQLGAGSWLVVAAGLVAMVGHNYPVWLRGRGGKGLATALGVGLALLPTLAWLTVGAAVVLIALTRNLAFSGAATGLVLSVAAWLAGFSIAYVVAPLAMLVVLGIAQADDLRRMWLAAPDKRDLILNRWIRDREAKL